MFIDEPNIYSPCYYLIVGLQVEGAGVLPREADFLVGLPVGVWHAQYHRVHCKQHCDPERARLSY